MQIPNNDFGEVSEALRASHEDKKRMRDTNLATIDAEIERYQTRMEKVYEDYLDEKIPESLYKRKFEEFRESQKSAQNKRINIEQIEDDYYLTVSHLLKLSKNAVKLFEAGDHEQKRSLISVVLSNLELDGDLLRYKYKKPFDTMAFCSKNSNWLPFIQTVRTEHYSYDPLRMKQIRELVDDFEAGNLDLQEKSYANA